MSCQTCERQRARIAALEEEVAAWKALACGSSSGLLAPIKTTLGISGADARLLARLIERPGIIHHAEGLYLVVATRDPSSLDSHAWRRVGVHMSRLRQVLRRQSLPEPQGVPREGWFYTTAGAATLRSFLDHAA